MPLTIDTIRATEDDEALFDLLSGELERHLPGEIQQARDLYHSTIKSLPRGLRAMAGMQAFDVSMTMDSLAWHFGNQNDERDLQETLNGLRELELIEIADRFKQMWDFFKPYMQSLQSGDFGGKEFSDWLVDIGAEDFAKDKDEFIWNYSEQAGELGLLGAWPIYARKYPERCVIPEDQQ